MIPVHEILHTILGEGQLTGSRCAVVRTYGCNLRCTWCDTPQENVVPRLLSVDKIVKIVTGTAAPVALVTGGEPLMHPEVPVLCAKLLRKNLKVVVETNGSMDLSPLPRNVIRIMDLKPPSSGFEKSSMLSNLGLLGPDDEVKIIVAGRKDYLWARRMIRKHLSAYKGTIHLSPLVNGDLPEKLAGWILADRLPARLNLQIHKYIFPSGEHAVF